MSSANAQRPRALIALCIASFVGCALLAYLRDSPYADFSGKFTDHLHHVYGAWLFWKHGLAVFSTPLALLSAEGWPHPLPYWGEVPWMYPPGTLLFFAPVTWLAHVLTLDDPQLAKLVMVYLLAWSHFGFYLFARACDPCPPGQRLLLRSFAWLLLTRLAVEGFYDPLWLGTGAAVVASAQRGHYERSLWWFALTATLHYRAFAFVPAAAYALFQLLRTRAPRNWPYAALACTALSCLTTVAAFVRMYPLSHAHRDKYPPLSQVAFWPLFWVVVLTALIAFAFLVWRRAFTGAATVVCVLAVAVTDFRGFLLFWHHAPTVLAAPIAAGLGVSAPTAQVARTIALLYGLALARLVWGNTPMDFLSDIIGVFDVLQPMILQKLHLAPPVSP